MTRPPSARWMTWLLTCMSCRAVVSSMPTDPESGYATPTAMIFALTLALVATALVQRSTSLLRLARADMQRTQIAYALDGAQLSTVSTVIRTGAGGPYRWALSTDLGWVEAVAESEGDKVGLSAAARLDDRVFQAMGIGDADALRVRLATAAGANPILDVGQLDAAPLWRACAASLISSFGSKSAIQPSQIQEPHMGDLNPAWRVGEVWRMQVTTVAGWRD